MGSNPTAGTDPDHPPPGASNVVVVVLSGVTVVVVEAVPDASGAVEDVVGDGAPVVVVDDGAPVVGVVDGCVVGLVGVPLVGGRLVVGGVVVVEVWGRDGGAGAGPVGGSAGAADGGTGGVHVGGTEDDGSAAVPVGAECRVPNGTDRMAEKARARDSAVRSQFTPSGTEPPE